MAQPLVIAGSTRNPLRREIPDQVRNDNKVRNDDGRPYFSQFILGHSNNNLYLCKIMLMQRIKSGFVVLALLLGVSAFAEETDSLGLKVFFRQNSSEIDMSYRENGRLLNAFTYQMNRIMSDPSCRIQEISIRSGASPEGEFYHNKDLSWNRSQQIKNYLSRELRLPDDKFRIDAVGEDWLSLWDLVKKNRYPDREEILDILSAHSDFIYGNQYSEAGSPKRVLMNLYGGRTWRWLLNNVFPELRSAGNNIICKYIKEEPRVERKVDTMVIIHKYIVEYPADSGEKSIGGGEEHPSTAVGAASQAAPATDSVFAATPAYDLKPVFAFRTNLLLPLMNVDSN